MKLINKILNVFRWLASRDKLTGGYEMFVRCFLVYNAF